MDQTNLLLESTLWALLLAVVAAVTASKLLRKRPKLPPGPTPVPFFGNWLQVGNNLDHRVLAKLAAKHGDLFHLRMGTRSLVVVSSPELAKEVLHTQGAAFGSRTRSVVFEIFSGGGQDLVFAPYGEHWRRMRRVMAVPFFSSRVVGERRREWEDEPGRLVEALRGAAEEAVELRPRLQLLMHNNVYGMMFGRRFESVDDPLFRRVSDLNLKRNVLGQSLEYNYADFIPVLRPFIGGYLKLCREVYQKRLDLFYYFLQERMRTSSLEKAGIDHLVEAEKKGEISKSNLLHLIENMNTAGLNTIARAIEWGVADLTNHQRVLRKLQLELDSVLGAVQITEPDTHRLPYLRAVVKEILRLRMVTPLLVPHMNASDARLGCYDVPAGSRVTVNAWWLANDPARWKRPEEFRPERFLEEESHVEVSGNDFRYVPFGIGRRSCPGAVLAVPILCVTLGRLVQNFDFRVPPGKEKIDMTERRGQFNLHMANPLTLVLKAR